MKTERLRASLSGTNPELLGDYNQRLIYEILRRHGPIIRGDLVRLTGLTKSTIATIVRRGIDSGLLLEKERIYGGRGQPATLLEINPAGCFAIGMSIARDRLTVVAIEAQGTVRARVEGEQIGISTASVAQFFQSSLDVLLRGIPSERMIGSGFALASDLMQANESLDFATLAKWLPGVPCFTESDVVSAAVGESLFGQQLTAPNFFYILIDHHPMGCLVINRTVYGDASQSGHGHGISGGGAGGWSDLAVSEQRRMTRSPGRSPNPVPEAWVESATASLLRPLISINCLLNPDAILLGGRILPTWLERLVRSCNEKLAQIASSLPSLSPVRAGALFPDSIAVGVAALAMRARLFPSSDVLQKTPAS